MLLPEEAATQQAENERQRAEAERLADRLRALGEDRGQILC
jgi:regulator of protease activity HflC (stomatin/prohibitin superfamily)